MADLSSTVLAFASPLTVTRTAVGSYVDGVYVPGAESTLVVQAAVFPLSGEMLKRMPDGLDSSSVREVFTVSALRVSAPAQIPDRVTIDGALWQVETVENWSAAGNFYRSLVRKEPA
jgi:hypothetical protein